MGAVAVHQDARLVELVVHVAGDMIALLDDQHLHAALLGQLPRRYRAGKAGAHHYGVKLGGIDFAERGVVHCHRGSPVSYACQRDAERAAHN